MFDSDGNGNITKEELSNIMGNVEDDFWKEVLLECDTN
jgi:calcium-dependent protein kinase